MEKQRDKAAKRMQRKTMKQSGGLDALDPDAADALEPETGETPDVEATQDVEAVQGDSSAH